MNKQKIYEKCFGQTTKAKIIEILLKDKNLINMTEMYQILNKTGHKLSYKNTVGNIHSLVRLNIIKTKECRPKYGRETKICLKN